MQKIAGEHMWLLTENKQKYNMLVKILSKNLVVFYM